MKRKIIFYALEVIIILIVVIYLAITKFIPEQEALKGSSEKLWRSSNYETAIEINIPTGPKFLLIINKNKILKNIFIENEEAVFLANKNIEEQKINKAIKDIMDLLLNNNKLNVSSIEVINYNDNTIYEECLNIINKKLQENNKIIEIKQQKKTLKDKIKEETFDITTEEELLWQLYLQSRDYISEYAKEEVTTQSKIEKSSAEVYADEIYQKLITYMINANVKDQTKDDSRMPIQYIPGDSANTIFPTTDSWYYIENSKVYAQINIESYKFCYNGSIENKSEGICS